MYDGLYDTKVELPQSMFRLLLTETVGKRRPQNSPHSRFLSLHLGSAPERETAKDLSGRHDVTGTLWVSVRRNRKWKRERTMMTRIEKLLALINGMMEGKEKGGFSGWTSHHRYKTIIRLFPSLIYCVIETFRINLLHQDIKISGKTLQIQSNSCLLNVVHNIFP